MKTFLFITFCLVATAGCNGVAPADPAGETPAVDPALTVASVSPATVALVYDSAVQYHNLSLRLIGLSDSRCPKGVTCRAAGRMSATIEVSRGNAAPIEIELQHAIKGEPTAAVAFDYEFRLRDIAPQPIYGVKVDRGDYRVMVEIRRP